MISYSGPSNLLILLFYLVNKIYSFMPPRRLSWSSNFEYILYKNKSSKLKHGK